MLIEKLTFSKKSIKNIDKMKLAIAAILAGSASAFAPAQVGKASTAMNAFECEL